MGEIFLNQYDIIELKPGMAVGFHHFEHIYYAAGTMTGSSTGKVFIDQIYKGRGDAWQARINLRNSIYELFRNEGRKVDEAILMRFLDHQVKDSIQKTFVIPSGLYVVTRIVTDGPQRRVYCKTYQPDEKRPEIEVFFFQGFHADASFLHEDLTPIKRL